MSNQESSVQLANHYLATKKLVFQFSITGHATPASKTHSVADIPSVVLLRTEGKVADADAVEDLSGDFTTAVDATNAQFGILLKATELGDVKKVLKVSVTQQTATGTAIASTPASSAFLTAGGNIAIDVLATGTDLASESPTFTVEVDYVKEL